MTRTTESAAHQPRARASRLLLLPLGVAVAGAALVHAGSENGVVPLAMVSAMHSTLNAEMQNRLVEVGFRTQVAQAADQQVTFEKMPDDLAELASDAFANDPLEVETLRTIALGRYAQEDPDKALELLEKATEISRRESMANMWLVQEYGRRGDLDQVLSNFDRALRTSSRVREAAMAPLVNLLAQPEAHPLLGDLLQKDPEWAEDFWSEFARNEVALDNAEAFFANNPVKFSDVTVETRRAIYNNLKRTRRFATLFHLAALDPDASISTSMDADSGFSVTSDGDPFGWQLNSTGNFATVVNRRSGIMEIDARAGSFGTAAERVVPISGQQVLGLTMAQPMPANARIDLIARCPETGGSELARVTIESGEKAGQTSFAAGACSFTNVQLTFNVEQGRRDGLMQIQSITLQPAE